MIRDLRDAEDAIQALAQAVNNIGPENLATKLSWDAGAAWTRHLPVSLVDPSSG